MKTDIAQLTSSRHPKLIELLVWLEEKTSLEFKVTSDYRPNDDGIHGTMLLRATDLSCKINAIGLVIEEYINMNWQYDPTRPDIECCLFHDIGQGKHLHIQVHDNTVMT